jgi:hypothetical protein
MEGREDEAKEREESARSSGASAVQRPIHFAKKGALPRVEVDAGHLILIQGVAGCLSQELRGKPTRLSDVVFAVLDT